MEDARQIAFPSGGDKGLGAIFLITGLVAAAFLIFWNLGKGSIDLRDEALTAGRSLYIHHTGSLVNLEVNGEISVRKPPLVYALTALSFKVFGVNELGLRVPNALFGLGIFMVTAWAAWRLAGPIFGGVSPWLLLGCFNIIRVSREALTDSAFVFGMSLGIISLAIHLHEAAADRGGEEKRHYPALFALGLAIALLSKGPLGFYAALISLAAILAVNRALFIPYLVASIGGSIPFVAWFICQASAYPGFLSIYLGEEYLERMDYDSEFLSFFIRPPLYYLSNLWRWSRLSGMAAVATTIWIVICWIRMHKRGTKGPASCRDTGRHAAFFLAISWIGYFLLLSLASHKSRRYILPIFPIMTILTSLGLASLFRMCRQEACRWAVSAITVLSVAVGLAALGRHYVMVPDYLPLRKDAAMKLRPLSDQGYTIYSDDRRLAPILHFYLDRRIWIVEGPKRIRDEKTRDDKTSGDKIRTDRTGTGRWVFVTPRQMPGAKGLNEEYRVIIHD